MSLLASPLPASPPPPPSPFIARAAREQNEMHSHTHTHTHTFRCLLHPPGCTKPSLGWKGTRPHALPPSSASPDLLMSPLQCMFAEASRPVLSGKGPEQPSTGPPALARAVAVTGGSAEGRDKGRKATKSHRRVLRAGRSPSA